MSLTAGADCRAGSKPGRFGELVNTIPINAEIVCLDFTWEGSAPKAGQFFMVRPRRSSVFLGRPISLALWQPGEKAGILRFLIARRGRGTAELAEMKTGDEAELTGPLGKAWTDLLPAGEQPLALIGGGIGLAPLHALAAELGGKRTFDFYAGFKNGFQSGEEKNALLGPALAGPRKLFLATEDGAEGLKGRIPDFLETEQYAAVCACGPEPMLQAVAVRCKAAGLPCLVSLERRMACGVGACLGCTVRTVHGNRRCCAGGPVFNANDIIF